MSSSVSMKRSARNFQTIDEQWVKPTDTTLRSVSEAYLRPYRTS